jgi:Peptidase inhibitor family I36/Domain of unknown function (DUF4214)
MVKYLVSSAAAAALILGVASAASAQEWGYGPTPRNGACFYKDTKFHGEFFCIDAGDGVRHMPDGMNDKITSIRLFGNATVQVYQDSKFEGRSTRFDDDVKDLHHEGWNDLISSIRVEGSRHHDGGGYGGGGYGGGGYGNPDQIIRRAYQDVLHREPDDAGMRVYRSHLLDDGWTETQVRDALRKSPEYREQNTMTYAKAQEIVRQAYLAVLRREPDSGARNYVTKVMNDRWAQQDVERELRKSSEYRSR